MPGRHLSTLNPLSITKGRSKLTKTHQNTRKSLTVSSFVASVGGFSLEFALLNPSGFFFYSVYSVAGRVNHNLGTGKVRCYFHSVVVLITFLYLVGLYLIDFVFNRLQIKTWFSLCTPLPCHRFNWPRSLFTSEEIKVVSASSGSFSSFAATLLFSLPGGSTPSVILFRIKRTRS